MKVSYLSDPHDSIQSAIVPFCLQTQVTGRPTTRAAANVVSHGQRVTLCIPCFHLIASWRRSHGHIPIVVAMAAQQNVVAALKGGPVAVLAGTAAVVVSFALVPVISRIGQGREAQPATLPAK